MQRMHACTTAAASGEGEGRHVHPRAHLHREVVDTRQRRRDPLPHVPEPEHVEKHDVRRDMHEQHDPGDPHLRPRDLLRDEDAVHRAVDGVEPDAGHGHRDVGGHEVADRGGLAHGAEEGGRGEDEEGEGGGVGGEEEDGALEDDGQLAVLLRPVRLQGEGVSPLHVASPCRCAEYACEQLARWVMDYRDQCDAAGNSAKAASSLRAESPTQHTQATGSSPHRISVRSTQAPGKANRVPRKWRAT